MRHVKYPRSSVLEQSGFPKTPAPASLDYGELAINYANGLETISVKNSNNSIVKFRPNTNVFVKNFLTPITSNDVCGVLSVANVYNYQNFEISFLEAYDGNLDLSDIIGYIKNTFYDVSDINLVMNVIKANDSEGAHTSFYINSETMQDLMDDASKPMSNKSSVIGFTKYGEYFIASDSTSMSGIEINWDHTTKAVTVRYSYMDNVYRMNGRGVENENAYTYFYVEDVSGTSVSNILTIRKNGPEAPDITVYKSTDQVNWTLMGTTKITGITTTIPTNGKVYLKATSNCWGKKINDTNYFNYIRATNRYNIGGNIMSLLLGDGFTSDSTLPQNDGYIFQQLFWSSDTLAGCGDLSLPSNTTDWCYYDMFSNCTSLTTAPTLPATTLTEGCYQRMFYGCTSLTTAPVLPATTLADNCYFYMFNGCTALTTAPELPATTLASNCYSYMFRGCSSLPTAPELPATTLASNCYEGMFNQCTSLTTAPELPATTLANHCYGTMFMDCSVLTTPPALPATTLAVGCYFAMFFNCKRLTTAPALPATTLASNCYESMFGYTPITTAPALPATTLMYRCYKQMFQHCTSLVTPPVLPATTLATDCYNIMFQDCTSLNSIITYAEDISASNCLYYWMSGVAATGDFYNMGTATYESGESGIPSGWTEHTSL